MLRLIVNVRENILFQNYSFRVKRITFENVQQFGF
jgi:hypothetical protein